MFRRKLSSKMSRNKVSSRKLLSKKGASVHKLSPLCLLLRFFSVITFFSLSVTTTANDLLIHDATVIDVRTGETSINDILIRNDKIVSVGTVSAAELSKETKIINATGQYVIPGLWDMHVHLTFFPELKDRLPAWYIANGVTSVRDMGSPLDEVLEFREQLSREGQVAPRIWIAGPMVDGSPRLFDGSGAFTPNISIAVNSTDEMVASVNYLAAKGVNLIKPYISLSLETFTVLSQQAKRHHLPIAGHIPNRVSLAEAVEAGIDDIQHLGGVHARVDCPHSSKMEGLPKVKASAISCSDLIKQFVEKEVWHTPTLVLSVGAYALNLPEDKVWFSASDQLSASLTQHFEELRFKYGAKFYESKSAWGYEMTQKMHEAGVKFLAGSDSPPSFNLKPGFGLHAELSALVQAGLSPLQALQTATLNPATFFNVKQSQGTIAVGNVADLVLLDANPLLDIANTQKINTVISQGRVFDRAALDLLLK